LNYLRRFFEYMFNNIQQILSGVQNMFGQNQNQTTQAQNPNVNASEEQIYNELKEILENAIVNDRRMFGVLKNMHDALGLNEQIRGRVQLFLGKAYNELSEKHKNYKR